MQINNPVFYRFNRARTGTVMFTTNLGLQDRKALMFVLIASQLVAYYRHGEWISDDARSKLMQSWLEQRGGKTTIMFRARLSQVTSNFARHLTLTLLREDGEHMARGLAVAVEMPEHSHPMANMLLDECERLLLLERLV